MLFGERGHEGVGAPGLVRRLTIMERDPGRLALDDQAGNGRREILDPRPDALEPDRHAERQPRPVRELQLEPVRARKGDAVQGQVALQIGERTAADDRQPPVQPPAQPLEHRLEVRRNADRVGRRGQLDQGTVEIEEQGCAPGIERRRRFQAGHAFVVGDPRGKAQACVSSRDRPAPCRPLTIQRAVTAPQRRLSFAHRQTLIDDGQRRQRLPGDHQWTKLNRSYPGAICLW